MLIEDGYTHSLKALLEKSRAEERELAARRAHGDPSDVADAVGVIDRVARLWTWFAAARSPRTTARSPASLER